MSKSALSRLLSGHRAASEASTAEDPEEEDAPETEDEENEEETAAAEGEGQDEEASAAEEDEDDGGKSASASAAHAERTRIRGIVRSKAAKGRAELALSLALDTDLSAEEAVKVLRSTPAESKGRLAAAMAATEQPNLGAGSPGDGGETDAATAKRLAGYVNGRQGRAA